MSQRLHLALDDLLPDYKTVNDPIHGHISLTAAAVSMIDTPQFQRLRDLKQLGTCYFVFPGASHCRFEHCIGVGHLAREWLLRLRRLPNTPDVERRDLELVSLAGLCHDLGHGPFSHVFDNEVIRQLRPEVSWTHEMGSVMMLEHMITENNLEFTDDDIMFMSSLILGERLPGRPQFLYDIVSNSRNGVDVDKFDYLARDCLNLGLKSSYDFSRLMQFSNVINDEICFQSKEVFNLYEMFHTRYALHKQVYTHKAGKATEYMITDALVKADEVMQFSTAIEDPTRYQQLTDCVLRQIEYSTDPKLAESRSIIARLRRRDLYRCAGEVLLSEADARSLAHITPEELVANKPSDSQLREEDVIFNWYRLNYSMKDKNPVDSIHFYAHESDTECFSIPQEKVSYMTPSNFQETYLRLFVRRGKLVEDARTAFRSLLRARRCVSPIAPSHSVARVKRVKTL